MKAGLVLLRHDIQVICGATQRCGGRQAKRDVGVIRGKKESMHVRQASAMWVVCEHSIISYSKATTTQA